MNAAALDFKGGGDLRGIEPGFKNQWWVPPDGFP